MRHHSVVKLKRFAGSVYGYMMSFNLSEPSIKLHLTVSNGNRGNYQQEATGYRKFAKDFVFCKHHQINEVLEIHWRGIVI